MNVRELSVVRLHDLTKTSSQYMYFYKFLLPLLLPPLLLL